MQPRAVLLKIARHLEARPRSFNYWAYQPPKTESGRACALGWAAFFLGIEKDSENIFDRPILRAAEKIVPRSVSPEITFYQRMNEIDVDWTDDRVRCAKALRAYVRRYHKRKAA